MGKLSNPKYKVWIPVFIFLVSSLIYIQYGFLRGYSKDNSLYLYMGQQLVEGIPPYISAFDIKPPIVAFLAGFGVFVANLLQTDNILTVRITFLIISCLTVVGIYYFGTILYNSQSIGILTAVIFTGFWAFGRGAVSGPGPKHPFILFVIIILILTAHKKWFWTGCFGSLAVLTWQLSVIFPVVSFTVAYYQSGTIKEKAKNLGRFVLGSIIPIAITILYFYINDALGEFLYSSIFFHTSIKLSNSMAATPSILGSLLKPVQAIFIGFNTMTIPIGIGVISIGVIYYLKFQNSNSFSDFIKNDQFAGFVLTLPPMVAWAFVDFQNVGDFYIFLPYLAIGFAWWVDITIEGMAKKIKGGSKTNATIFFFTTIIFVFLIGVNYRWTKTNGLLDQMEWAQSIEDRLKIWRQK